MNEELLKKMKDEEDSLVERKPPNCNDKELRKEFVAFANSVPSNSYGVVFVGISDSGDVIGVENTDERQKRIRRVAEDECYPAVKIEMYVLSSEGKNVIAVVIRASRTRPHFTGIAYVRRGSECVKASEQEYEKLINSRNDKCREITEQGEIVFSVVTERKKLGDPRVIGSGRRFHECKVVECNQHSVRLYDISLNQNFSEPLENVSVLYDEERHRPMLLIQPK